MKFKELKIGDWFLTKSTKYIYLKYDSKHGGNCIRFSENLKYHCPTFIADNTIINLKEIK